MIRAPSVMRCRSMSDGFMKMNTIASTSGTESATTMPVRAPSDSEADEQHDRQRLDEGTGEFADRLLDDLRLVGDLLDVDADRRLGARPRPWRLRDSRRRSGHCRPWPSRRRRTIAGIAVLPRRENPAGPRSRRVTLAMSPSRNTRRPTAIGVAAIACGALSAPVTRSGIRLAEVSNTPASATAFCLASESKIVCGAMPRLASLRLAEFDENPAVLLAVNFTFTASGVCKQALAHDFDDLFQLVIIGALAADGVKHRIDVAEFVVDVGPIDSGRQIAVHVAQFLAQLIKQARALARAAWCP